MSNGETEGLSEQEIAERTEPAALKVTVNGDIHDATNVLRDLHGQMILPREYSIVPGNLYGTHEITVSIPRRSRSLERINQLNEPNKLLAKNKDVLDVSNVTSAARRHIRLLTDQSQPDAGFLTETVVNLGGHIAGRDRDILKLTADLDIHRQVMSFSRSMGAVLRGRANMPYASVIQDPPEVVDIDTTRSPDYAPDVSRYIVNARCWPQFQNDVNIIDILRRHGFQIGSVSSRMREDNENMQELTILVQDGNSSQLRRAFVDIWPLAGVERIDPVEEANAFQYLQATFPMNRRGDFDRALLERDGLHNRGKMTKDFEFVLSGSVPLKRAAIRKRDFAKGEVAHRNNPGLLQGLGPKIQDDVELSEGARDIMRSRLIQLVENYQAKQAGDLDT